MTLKYLLDFVFLAAFAATVVWLGYLARVHDRE
jgi:hypothetical protein